MKLGSFVIRVTHPAAVAAVAAALAAPAFGQGFDIRSWFPGGTTGTVSPPATAQAPAPQSTPAPAPSSPPPWSGESGSSGHPLMTADAIRASAANFRACLEGLWPQAA